MLKAFTLILLNLNFSLNQTLLIFLLYVRQTWMTQLIVAISLWGYLPLIRKDSVTHMHGLAVYVKKGIPFAWDLSLENSVDSYVFDQLYFTQCLTPFSSINHLLCHYAQFILFHLSWMRF